MSRRYRTPNSRVRLHYIISFAVFVLFCSILTPSKAADSGKSKIFRETLRSYTNDGTRAVTGADLDGDGDIDLVTANLKTSRIAVFLNNGEGGISGGSTYSVHNGPLVMHPGDLDNDGDIDLAILCISASKVSIMSNRGTSSLTAIASYTVTGSPSDLCIGDFNGDGMIDLVTANSN